MKVTYLSRFDRAFRKFDTHSQKEILEAIDGFLDNLVKAARPQGLGLRRLYGPFWEFRVGLKYRVLFELGKDEVRRFLKSI